MSRINSAVRRAANTPSTGATLEPQGRAELEQRLAGLLLDFELLHAA